MEIYCENFEINIIIELIFAMKFIELGGWAGIWLIVESIKKSRNLGDKYDLMFVVVSRIGGILKFDIKSRIILQFKIKS